MINIQNGDNECFRCCLARYISSVSKNPAKIKTVDKSNLILKAKNLLVMKKTIQKEKKKMFLLMFFIMKMKRLPYLNFKKNF